MQSDFKQGLWWATNVIIHSLIFFLLCSAMWTKNELRINYEEY